MNKLDARDTHEARLRKLIDPAAPIFHINQASARAIEWSLGEIDRLRAELAAERARLDRFDYLGFSAERKYGRDGETSWVVGIMSNGMGVSHCRAKLRDAIIAATEGR